MGTQNTADPVERLKIIATNTKKNYRCREQK